MLRKYHAKLQKSFFSQTARTARSRYASRSCSDRFIDEASVVKALSSISRLYHRPTSIFISALESDPDVYLLYLRPEGVMKIVQAIQRIDGKELTVNLSSIASVCGNCTVRLYVTDEICISFGCTDSRKYGGVESNELIVEVPREKAKLIMNSYSEMQNNM